MLARKLLISSTDSIAADVINAGSVGAYVDYISRAKKDTLYILLDALDKCMLKLKTV